MNRSQFRVLATALLAWGPAAGLAKSPVGHILACRSIAVPSARLACFDRESALLAEAEDGGAQPGSATGAGLGPRQTFGLPESTIAEREISAGIRPQPIAHISGRVTHLAESPDGRTIFSLDNGQVWMEILPEHDLLAQVGQTAIIKRQVFGSYWMELQNGRGCKVTRLR